jgi:hypothetical protein
MNNNIIIMPLFSSNIHVYLWVYPANLLRLARLYDAIGASKLKNCFCFMLDYYLSYSSILKIEAACSSETSAGFQRTAHGTLQANNATNTKSHQVASGCDGYCRLPLNTQIVCLNPTETGCVVLCRWRRCVGLIPYLRSSVRCMQQRLRNPDFVGP